MKTFISCLLFVFVSLSSAEPIPRGHPTIQQGIDAISPGNNSNLQYHEGTVLSTIPTRHYTYVEVQQTDKIIWLAVATLTLADGAIIRYRDGVSMTDFYSSTLKREFPKVLFIGSIEVVK